MSVSQAENAKKSSSILANPAPLGLMGFGATTVLLNLYNAGIISSTSIGMIFAMGLFYGGLAQVIAGILEFVKGNTFGMVAFTSYGMFWIAVVALLVFPVMGWAKAVDGTSMALFFAVWGIFTAYMFVATLKKNLALQVVFGTLTILFVLLAIADYTGIAMVKTIAGYEGILCGASAIYLACAEVMNESFGKKVLPV
ncbi:MAG TPA: acetate uptake transporter [Methanocella sp.]|nr:acetate uptake transporter [Methanocella sp.]